MQKFANNWQTVLSAPLASTDNTLTVPTAQADKLTFASGDYYDLTLDPNGPAPEILRITGKSGGVLTIGSRAREGTVTPGSWAADTVIACTVTAGFMALVQLGGNDVTEGTGQPSGTPENNNAKYIDTSNGYIYLASYNPVLGGGTAIGWKQVWPQTSDAFLPDFNILSGGIRTAAAVSFSSLYQTLITFYTETQGGGDNPQPYVRGTTFITVTSAAEVQVQLEGSNPALFLTEGSGYLTVGGQTVGFDLANGDFAASFSLAPGVYPLILEAHLVIPSSGTSYPCVRAKLTSGAASARRGIAEVLGDVYYN